MGESFMISKKKHHYGFGADNLFKLIIDRQIPTWKYRNAQEIQKSIHGHGALIRRLSLDSVLEAHEGCVNSIRWNQSGSFLVSGSDDTKICVWDYGKRTAIESFESGHSLNIFGVCFVPHTNDTVIASGAMDCEVRIHYAPFSTPNTQVFRCHSGRVKDVISSDLVPQVFWSAAEDGYVRQFDLRCLPKSDGSVSDHSKEVNNSGSLINVGKRNAHSPNTRAMGISIHPLDSNIIGLACGDPYIRLYDRRMLRLVDSANLDDPEGTSFSTMPFAMYSPPHLSSPKLKSPSHGTSIQFSGDGSEILASYHGDQIYLYHYQRQGDPCKQLKQIYDTSTYGEVYCDEPDFAYDLKKLGNIAYADKSFSTAIKLYSRAIEATRDEDLLKLLHNNRCAALIQRNWRGDAYLGLCDCRIALNIDPMLKKAHHRMIHCLKNIGLETEANEEIRLFKAKFPDDKTFSNHNESKRKRSESDLNEEEDDDGSHYQGSNSDDSYNNIATDIDELVLDDYGNGPIYSPVLRRFVGYVNVQTDIKEAKFMGKEGTHIVSGSDDGKAYFWEKETGKLIHTIDADRNIVNCVQCHPYDSCLATSGIENVVKLFIPKGEACEVEDDFMNMIETNQEQMNKPATMTFMESSLNPRLLRILLQNTGDDQGVQQCTQS